MPKGDIELETVFNKFSEEAEDLFLEIRILFS